MKRAIGAAKMTSHWTFWLMVAGFAYVSASQCNTDGAKACYEDLVNYETIVFPLYGHDEVKLDETCGHINESFNCIRKFVEVCHESDQCDEDCDNLIKDIHSFLTVTGLTKLAANLCHQGSPLREVYLESIECLETNADGYASCHNDSQASQHYMHSTTGPSIEESCCYISWYQDCFTNVTRDNCGVNATFLVSMGAHNLLGLISDQLCTDVPITCDRPPLPPEGYEEDKPEDSDLDKDKPDKIDDDIDNSLNDPISFKASATLASYSTTLMVLPYIFIVLSKYL